MENLEGPISSVHQSEKEYKHQQSGSPKIQVVKQVQDFSDLTVSKVDGPGNEEE